jgi:glycosyltransferase involved in cell wall biosynthesis
MHSQQQKPDVWIVLDNSTDPDQDWSIACDDPLVQYHKVPEQPIGALRNRCLELALEQGADYIVFWDDDDYYPPTRISSGVRALESHPEADISGSSLMYLLLARENVLMTTGPFHDQHATAATWTLRRRCAERCRFQPDKLRGEEVTFTDNWKVPMTQVSADEMIVVMGHNRNTVDKSDLMKRPHMYCAKFVNKDNGKQVFRLKWPVKWDLWKSTFSV